MAAPSLPALTWSRDIAGGRLLRRSSDGAPNQSWIDWWTGDPWTLGSYAAFGPGQTTRFWHGVGKAKGRCHFAGEHTSTYSQGFLNGGVESGDRTAIEVMKALGIPVPHSIANLPYSTIA
jgi:monoamine oxidase